MKSLKGILGLMSTGALMLAVLPAAAATLSDSFVAFTTPSPGNLSGFLGGVTADESEPPDTLHSVDHGLGNGAMWMRPIVVMEPDGTTISDIFGVINNGDGTYAVAFISDPLNPNGDAAVFGVTLAYLLDPLNQVLEGPGGISLSVLSYINPSLSPTLATFTSDGNVPDGGLTLALLGFALVGVEGLRRKLRK